METGINPTLYYPTSVALLSCALFHMLTQCSNWADLLHAGSASAAQQPHAYMAASPTLPGVFIANPPDDTPAPTLPVCMSSSGIISDKSDDGVYLIAIETCACPGSQI